MPSSSSSAPSYTWSSLSSGLKNSAGNTIDANQEESSEAAADPGSSALNLEIATHTGSELSPAALANLHEILMSISQSMTNDLKNASNAAFNNYPWSGSTTSPSTTVGVDEAPSAEDIDISPANPN